MKLNIDMVINSNDYNSDLQRFLNINMQLFYVFKLFHQKTSALMMSA